MKIYSNITGELLHIIHRFGEFGEKRKDIVPAEQYLQCASLTLGAGDSFRAHKHIDNYRVVQRAQESWCVVKGKVIATLYDIDDKVIINVELNAGDISITLRGGHTYTAVEDSLVYEYKCPQYMGQSLDKVFIDEVDNNNV